MASKWVIMCKHWSKHIHWHKVASEWKKRTRKSLGHIINTSAQYTEIRSSTSLREPKIKWERMHALCSIQTNRSTQSMKRAHQTITTTTINEMRMWKILYMDKYRTQWHRHKSVQIKIHIHIHSFIPVGFVWSLFRFILPLLLLLLMLLLYMFFLYLLFPTGNILIYLYRVSVATATHFGCCVCTNPCQFQKSNYLRLIADISAMMWRNTWWQPSSIAWSSSRVWWAFSLVWMFACVCVCVAFKSHI